MPQFFYKQELKLGDEIEIREETHHHLFTVRREKVDNEIKLRQENGDLARARILQIDKKKAICKITHVTPYNKTKYSLTLAMPLLKAKANDFIIEKGVEVGITHFVPIVYERSIPDKSAVEKKRERWERIAHEAYKQSMPPFLPTIADQMKSIDFFSSHQDAVKIVADVHAELSKTPASQDKSVTVAVGPEGGFSRAELELASANGWLRHRYFANQLRAETAGIVIPSIVANLYFL